MIANRPSIDRDSIDSSRSRSIFSVKSHSTFYSNGTKLSSTYSIPSTRKQQQITHNQNVFDTELAILNHESHYNTQSNRNDNEFLNLNPTMSFDRHHIKAHSSATIVRMGNNYDNTNPAILPCLKTTIKQVQPADFVVINDLPYPIKIQFPAKISERETQNIDKIKHDNQTPLKYNKYNNNLNSSYNNNPNNKVYGGYSQNLSTLLENPKTDRNDTSEFEMSILDGYGINAVTSTPKSSPTKKPSIGRALAFDDDLDFYDSLGSIYEQYMKL